MISLENLVINGLKFMYAVCQLSFGTYICFSDVPTVALKSHGISGHVTVR